MRNSELDRSLYQWIASVARMIPTAEFYPCPHRHGGNDGSVRVHVVDGARGKFFCAAATIDSNCVVDEPHCAADHFLRFKGFSDE